MSGATLACCGRRTQLPLQLPTHWRTGRDNGDKDVALHSHEAMAVPLKQTKRAPL